MQSFFKQEQEAYSLLWGMVARQNGPTGGTFHSQGDEEGVTLPACGLEAFLPPKLWTGCPWSMRNRDGNVTVKSTVEVDIAQIPGEQFL